MSSNNHAKLSFHFYNSIKVLISFYKFADSLKRNKSITNEKLFLIDKKWFDNYKDFYLCNDLFQLIKKYNITNFEAGELKILYNNLFKKFYDYHKLNSNVLMFYDKEEELPKIISTKVNESICYVNDFDIINEKTLLNLKKSMGDFYYEDSIKENIDLILYEGKVIIKYIREKYLCYNLIIGTLKFNNLLNVNFSPEIIVNFKVKDELEIEFNKNNILEKYLQYNYSKEIIVIQNNYFKEITNNTYNIKYLCEGYKYINESGMTRIPSGNSDSIDIINFFIRLNENYKEINQKFLLSICQESEFYLVNKNWIDKYKNFYSYSELVNIIKNNPNAINILNNIKNSNNNEPNYISDLINKTNRNNNPLIFDLSHINLTIIDYIYPKTGEIKKDCIKIFHNFELWTEKALHYFNKIGFNLKPKKIKCFFSEQFLFILEERKTDNIFMIYEYDEINNNFFESVLIKCRKKEEIINTIKKNKFTEYINKCNFNEKYIANLEDSNDFILILSEKGRIYDKFKRKDRNINILISILLFNAKLRELIEKSQPQPNKISKKGEIFHLDLFLVNKNLFNEYLKNKGLKDIYDKINDIDILTKCKEYTNIEKRQFLKNYIIKMGFKQEQSNNNLTKTPNEKPQMDKIIVKNHNETISYHNDICFLDKETINLLNKEYKKFLSQNKCLIIDKYIIIVMNYTFENIFEIGKLNKEGIFNIEIIIKFTNGLEEEKKRFEKLRFNDYIYCTTVFSNDKNSPFYSISPFLNKDNKIIGNAYKIDNPAKIKDFSDYAYNKIFIKMLHFIYYLKKNKPILNNKNLILDNSKQRIVTNKYYLINEKCINDLKQSYDYDNTLKALENNKLTNTIFNNFKIDEEENLKLKKFLIIIQKLQDINKSFNKKGIKLNYPNEEPDITPYNIDNTKFFIYDNFMFMNKYTYDKILDLNKNQSDNMELKNNYCECFFVDDLIFIILKKEISNFNKKIIEVGTLKSEFIFELNYILIYNTERDFIDHFKFINNQIGIKNFIKKNIDFKSQNIHKLCNLATGKEIGYICLYKYNANIQDDNDIISNFTIPQINEYIPIKQKFTDPPGIGLQNVGATCYMNATLQCLCQIEKLVDHFKSYKRINTIINDYELKGEDCLSTSFKNLIENLWPTDDKYIKKNKKYNRENTNNKYFIPKEFKEKISKMNNLFEGAKANDSKDLVNFIIMRLHEELNEGKKSNNNIMAPPQEDQMSMFNYFKMNNDQENKSIISDLFYGINGTMNQCSYCQTKKHNFQIGFFYIFPLEEIRKFKIQNLQNQCMQNMQFLMPPQVGQMFPFNMNNNMMLFCQPQLANIQNINSVTIKDCFDFNQKMETMAGENSMYCNICKRQETAYYQSYIVTSPEIIIIILNRGKGIEFNVKLEFYEFLNIQEYVQFNKDKSNYKLIGVVTHLGESGASGHFIAYCKSPIDDKWYNYNDELFFPVNDFKKQVIDYGMPYILFYQRI